MPRPCLVRRHQHREDIDKDLVAGIPCRHIASRYGMSTTSLQRHKSTCRRM